MAATGMRRGEALAVSWSDVHQHEQWIDVDAALGVVNDRVVRGPLKSGKPRRIPIGQLALEAFRVQRRRQNRWRSKDQAQWTSPWDLVFTERNGSPILPILLTTRFRRPVRRAGVPVIRLHDLRHTHAILLLEAGVPIHVVGHRLGHQSIWATLHTYAHVTEGSGRQAADRFDDLTSIPYRPDRP